MDAVAGVGEPGRDVIETLGVGLHVRRPTNERERFSVAKNARGRWPRG